MSLGAPEEFSSDDLAIMKNLGIEPEQQATGEGGDKPATSQTSAQPDTSQATTTAHAPASTTTPEAAAPAAAPAAPEEPAKPQGDVRAALRASRRAEARARDEAERLRAENEALKARLPADQAPPSDELTDEEIAAAERDFPLLGKTARFVKKAQAAQPAAAPAPTTSTEFVPPALPPAVQEVVDSNEALLAWQHDPDQGRFTLAKTVDALLSSHPQWKDKPMAERFDEVVRRVNAELGIQPATTRRDPAEVLAGVPRQTPETLSGIGGGGGKQPEAPALSRYMQMSDDQILADLARLG